MTPDMNVVWKRLDGVTVTIRPGVLPLVRLQLGRAGYDPAEDMAALSKVVPPEEIAAFLAKTYDRDHEVAKMTANGSPQARIDAALAYFDAIESGGKTLEEACLLIAMKDGAWEGGEVVVVEESAVLAAIAGDATDVQFRPALDIVAGAVVCDMQKAREIHKGRLRALREPLLEALDTEYTRLDEGTNDNGAAGSAAKLAKKAVALKRQALRDVTADPAIAAAQTPEELKAVLPVVLFPAPA